MRLQDLAGPKQDENLVIIWVNAMCWQVKTPIYKMFSPTLDELVSQAKAWPKLVKVKVKCIHPSALVIQAKAWPKLEVKERKRLKSTSDVRRPLFRKAPPLVS